MSAEEMFEKLGYKKETYNFDIIYSKDYEDNFNNYECVSFNKYDKTFSVYEVDNDDGYIRIVNVCSELFRAIQKQIEELGW